MAHSTVAEQGSNAPINGASVVKTLVKFMDDVYGAFNECVTDENGTARLLYFQDYSMKVIFKFYPDRVCVDSTYKHFDINLFTYVFMCEDSNGRNHIIAIGFLQANDIESLVWLFNTFKKHNPNWREIKLMAIDPFIKERQILSELFPDTFIVMCYFHVYTSFKNYMNDLTEMGVISEEQNLKADCMFKNLYFAEKLSDFAVQYTLFLDLPNVVVTYFQDVWLPKLHDWRISIDYYEKLFDNLNNFLQEFTGGIKAICAADNSYIEFIKNVFLFISLKNNEPRVSVDIATFFNSHISAEHQTKVLTPYSAKIVHNQLNLSCEIQKEVYSGSGTFIFDYLGMPVAASPTSCSCCFFTITLLPCRHIFKVRKLIHLSILDENLIHLSWSMKYYKQYKEHMSDLIGNEFDITPEDHAVFTTDLFESTPAD